jgi:chromosome segregation protein
MLKRLELLGFKSFASRSVFEFERGISALVGPNGSGKSNVADAVRWVLGEQSAKALRGKKAEEVIFLGSAERHPLGMAEVALVLENEDRRLPLDFSEVRLARRLYRSGESEYLINGAQARRRDLVNLLLQVGLHAEGYTVIGQGAVDELIMQRPDERRAVLEHAADISRHQARLSEARAKLTAVDQNLTRCRDLVAELEPHARRLRAQADKAQRYAARRAELAGLARSYYRTALAEKWRSHEAAASQLSEAAAKCNRLEDEIAAREQDRSNARHEVAALDAQFTTLRARLSELHRDRDSRMAELAMDRQRAGFLQARIEAAMEAARRAAERAAQLANETAAAQPELELDGESPSAAELHRLETLVGELDTQLHQAREAWEAARRGHIAVTEERQRWQNEDEEARERRAQAREAAAEVMAGHAALRSRLDQNLAISARVEHELIAARKLESGLSAAVATARRERGEAESHLAEARGREQKVHTELELARAALAAILDDADVAAAEPDGSEPETDRWLIHPLASSGQAPYEEAGIGTRNGEEGAHTQAKRLGASFAVPPEYEPAIAAALGEWARAELVADPGAAHSVVAGERSGRELFIACVHDGDHERPGGHFSKRLEQALAGIPYQPAAEVVGRRLNGNGSVPLGPLAFTVIVADLDTANRARERLSGVAEQPWQVSTLSGQVITHLGGWARGSESSADRLVSLRRREAEARSRIAELEVHAEVAARRRAAAEGELRAVESREHDSRAGERAAAAEIRLLAQRCAELQAERHEAEAALAALDRSSRPIESTIAESDLERHARRDELARQAAQLAGEERLASESLQELQRRWERAWSEREEARRLVERVAAERSAREEVAATRAREIRRLRDEESNAIAETQRMAEEQVVVHDRLEASESAAARLSAQIADVTQALDDLSSRRTTHVAAADQVENRTVELRQQMAHAQRVREGALLTRQQAADELARLREEAESTAEEWGLAGEAVVQLSLTRSTAEAAALSSGASDGRQLDQAAPERAASEPEFDLASTRRRLVALQRELRTDGATSESVLEEHREVEERLRFLAGQSADLGAAMQELEGVIEELESMMRRGFTAAFERVNAAFDDTFARLFGGGTARLLLTDPDEPLRTGVEVVAQPPGKRLQNLMSLSGGERALTSTALIFALLAINPLPFCVLDEVDAALDESNARRFAALLQEHAQRTQFIIITHNRATMEIAAALYGISMGGDGVTTVLSLRPSEALAYV